MWAHTWAPMQPPPTLNFGLSSNFFFVYRILSMRQKTKNHQNQGSIDKKFDFFPQSPTHIPRWVHLVQKTRAKNSHAWAPLISIRIAEGTHIFKCRLYFWYFNLSNPSGIAKHYLLCVQFADSAGNLLPGL